MTVLQDWLNDRPMDPRSLKTLICGAIRNFTDDEPQATEPPQLLRRGVERC